MKTIQLSLMIAVFVCLTASQPADAEDRSGSSKEVRGPSGLVIQSLDGGVTPGDLANAIAGSGVAVSNISFTGAQTAGGTFSNGAGILSLAGGIVLGSGNVNDVVGPNTLDDVTTAQGTPGDSDLDSLSGFTTLDAAVLEFDIVPDAATLFIRYVFASDEYNEFVGSQFNDVFAFFVNGTNCALIDGDPVSVNTVNGGNPFGDAASATNSGFYRNNDLDDGGGSIDTEMDGLTVVLTCQAAVNVGVANTVKLAIADATDATYDSAVFIEGGGVTTTPPPPTAGEAVPVPLLDRFGLVMMMLLLGLLGSVAVFRRLS